MNSSLYTAVLGLKNQQTKMDVIGNNIANVSTYGFKKGRATFADLLSQTYSTASAPRNGVGGTNALQVGLGVYTAAITNIMTQGQIEATGRATDVAINGNGWFILQGATGQHVYTRDGSFGLDKDGSLVNADGWYVQGWTTVNADQDHNFTVNTQTTIGDIVFQYGDKLEAQATNKVSLKCNLDSESRSLLPDGTDTKEGYATTTDLLVDLYNSDDVNPTHLGVREGDWIEIHVNTSYTNQTAAVTTPISLVGGVDVNGDGSLWRYTGLIDSSFLPVIDDASLTFTNFPAAATTRSYNSPSSLVAGEWTFNPDTGEFYVAVAAGSTDPFATAGTTIATATTQSSAENTLPYETDKYLYFQVTNDTTIGDLETAIQNALDAIDVNGTMNFTVEYDTDEAKFVFYNNAVSGSFDYNDLKVDINAVSGSGIRQAYLLRESTYDGLTGTRLGIVNGGLSGEMTREVLGEYDYQVGSTSLDYGLIDGSADVYGQVVRAYLTCTYDGVSADLNVATAGDWTGYTAGGTLEMLEDTSELSVDGTVWRRVSNFTGAANEYRVSTNATDVPIVLFNTTDGQEPAANAKLVFTYRTQNAPNKLLVEGTDYTIDSTTGNVSLIWNNSTASSMFGVSTSATTGGGFTGTIRLTADYTTEDRKLEPPEEVMNSRWADFAQELAEVTEGGDGKGRTLFNNMFSAINASRSATTPGTISDQGTSSQPTSKTTSRFQSADVYRTSIDVYDSLGEAHTLQFVFTNVGSNYDLTQQVRNTNRWYWRAELSYDDTYAFDSMDNIDDSATAKNEGQLTFDEDGLIISSPLGNNSGPIMFDPSPIGANGNSTHSTDTVSIRLNFDGNGEAIDGVTQYASDFTTKAYEQNGWAMGVLESFAVDSSGVIEGTYSNDIVKPLAQLALAIFPNEEGLVKLGDNTFGASANTGVASIVAADVGGAGSFEGSSLEQSNVDIVEEFTSMIVTERGFQANSRMITTSDEMLTEVINLKR